MSTDTEGGPNAPPGGGPPMMAAPAWSGTSPASRPVLLFLLLVLICGQAFWVYRRVSGTSALMVSNASPGAHDASPSAAPTTPDEAVNANPLPPGQVPRNPRLEPADIASGLAGVDSRLILNMPPRRRLDVIKTLQKLHAAEMQRFVAVEAMRATFSEEQATKIPDLIQQGDLAHLGGEGLIREARRVLSKIANDTSAPTAISSPVPAAATFDWDQSLRGAIALNKTTAFLTSSQAAQILAAIPELDSANKQLRLYQSQLNGQLTQEERQKIYRFRPVLRARKDEIVARGKGNTTLSRLLDAAVGNLQSTPE